MKNQGMFFMEVGCSTHISVMDQEAHRLIHKPYNKLTLRDLLPKDIIVSMEQPIIRELILSEA